MKETPLVEVVVPGPSGVDMRVPARLIGRLTRREGVAIAAEVAVRTTVPVVVGHGEAATTAHLHATRYTLMPVENVRALNDEARALMADVGAKPGLASA